MCICSRTQSHTGEAYPPTTVYSLLLGVLHYMKSENPFYPNFLDKNNPAFSTFTVTVDNLFKNLWTSGVGATSKQTEGISKEEELLWTSNVLNVSTPLGLLRAGFFYNGKCFCLRGGLLQICQFPVILKHPENLLHDCKHCVICIMANIFFGVHYLILSSLATFFI